MPRKKIARAYAELEEDLLPVDEDIQKPESGSRRNGGLDIYDEDGELYEEGEPTYIEEEEEEEE
jgi:hypothetical protein